MAMLLEILKINEVIVFFAYGLVFFCLGLAIALQSRRHSRLALAEHIKWLAGFGLVHGLYEWGHAFIPIQASYLSSNAVGTLEAVRTGLLVASFYLLLKFGTRISLQDVKSYKLLRFLPEGLLLVWLILAMTVQALVFIGPVLTIRLPLASDLARAVLGFPGASASALGMLKQAGIVQKAGAARLVRHFRLASVCFALYAILAGLAASRGEWVLLSFAGLASQSLSDTVSIPTVLLRSIAGLGITLSTIRGLEVFELEIDKSVQERDELREKQRFQTRLLARVIAAQEEERKRIARELHDEMGQRLSAVVMGLAAVAQVLPHNPARAQEILEDCRETAVQALEGVRQTIIGLRPSLLDDLGLLPALRRMAEDISRRGEVDIQISAKGVGERLPPEVEIALFRILQEAMTNVARHARARRAVLRLMREDDILRAMLEDDGVGFNPAEVNICSKDGAGLGLIGMQERALLIGGSVVIDSAPGRGTRVCVSVPLGEGS